VSELPRGDAAPDHYSYRVYADPAMAQAFDTLRFSGPIGTLVAEDQWAVLRDFLAPLSGLSVLDVGTGTGRAAIALAGAGALVTGVDASEQMLGVARERAVAAGVSVAFDTGDAHALAFPDRAFDTAVSLRVLMHTPGWRTCLRELCRVSRDRIVFDYPAAVSVAAIQAASRRLAARLGSGTEAYRVFTDRAIDRELAGCGFRVTRRHRQFVLPIALHKAVNARSFTRVSERVLAGLGLRWLCGSPVTVVAERCASS